MGLVVVPFEVLVEDPLVVVPVVGLQAARVVFDSLGVGQLTASQTFHFVAAGMKMP